MMWWNDGWNGMMNQFSFFGGLTWILADVALVLLIVWLWQKVQSHK